MSPKLRPPSWVHPTGLALLAAGLVAGLLVLSGRPAQPDDVRAQRRAAIQKMTAAEKERIRRRQEQFARLAPEERERIRRLHAAIEAHPQADQLRQVMQRYCEWLKTLSLFQREELLELEPEARVERVRQWMKEQDDRIARHLRFARRGRGGWARRMFATEGVRLWWDLPEEDRRAVRQWLEALAAEHLPEALREEFQKAEDADDRRRIIARVFFPPAGEPRGKERPRLAPTALDDLRARLSPKARRVLEQRDAEGQFRLVADWVRLSFWFEFLRRRAGPGPTLPAVSDQKLAEFLENDLSPAERDRLFSLPPEEMKAELKRLYYRRRMDDDGRPGGPFGPRPGGGRGPGRGGPPRGPFGQRPTGPPPNGARPPAQTTPANRRRIGRDPQPPDTGGLR